MNRLPSPLTKQELRENRLQARLAGASTYQGRPCPEGHSGVRFLHDMQCIECVGPSRAQRAQFKQNLADAIARGDATFQGKPCSNGHTGLRFTSAKHACVECSREREQARVYPEDAVAEKRAWARAHARARKKEDPAYGLWKLARNRARSRGMEFSITVDDIVVPEVCPVLGVKLILGANWAERPHAPSLDRVNNSKGYIPGNVQVISLRANTIKNDSLLEELEQVVAYIKAHS